MARIIVPMDELAYVLRSNLQLPPAIRSLEGMSYGLRIGVRPMAMLPQFYLTVQFERFERPTAQFRIGGVPSFVKLGSLMEFPPWVAVSGDRLQVKTDMLLRSQLQIKGLAVSNVAWENGALIVDTAAESGRR